ncbi:MAG: MFS transporter [Rickettsiales bacterium]|nr:MFS transporter [Rickettsiales bacterium]
MNNLTINFRNLFSVKTLDLIYLIIIGELIFALPFHISRFFRPALIEDYKYSNMSLGIAFSIYGITALISYIPGGYIADRLSPRYLLFASLLLTSLGGIFLLYNPSTLYLYFIYAYWGITTILFFWGALIKATRNISGDNQGLSFGALEAGRGLVASLCASAAVLIYSDNKILLLINSFSDKEISPLFSVILFYTIITFLSSFLILFFFQEKRTKFNKVNRNFLKKIFLNLKPIFLIAIIVLGAYSGYKGIDYYSLYFVSVLEYTKEEASLLVANLSYLRPISAILAGLIADRVSSKKCTTFLFLFLFLSYFSLSFLSNVKGLFFLLFFNFVISLVSIFSLRGIFYSLLKEVNVPISITGIAVGIISFIGYFPDVFIGPIFGLILDSNSGIEGFQNCFLFLMLVSSAGYIVSLFLPKKNNKLKY